MRNLDCGITSAIASCSFEGGDGDRDQFVGFLLDCGELGGRNQFGFLQQFEPEQGLVAFFFDNAHLRDEISGRFRTASCAIICCDRRAGTHDLRCKGTTRRCLRQRIDKLQGPKRKLLRALFQIGLIPHSESEFRIYFLGSAFEGVGCAGGVSCSGIGFTGIPGCSSCRRVETTFSPSLRPFFTIRLPSKVLAVSRVRRSIVLSGFTTKAYFTPCCELIKLSATSAARYGVAPPTRTRIKKPDW